METFFFFDEDLVSGFSKTSFSFFYSLNWTFDAHDFDVLDLIDFLADADLANDFDYVTFLESHEMKHSSRMTSQVMLI